MKQPCKALVCFAVTQEAAWFKGRPFPEGSHRVITGMGRTAARAALTRALEKGAPQLVMSCGFAGALDPMLPLNALVYADSAPPEYASILREAGARPVRFHCSKRVAVTTEEKMALYRETRCHAVEMESAELGEVCRERGIPFVVLRVISDAADENMVLDFNQFMTKTGKTHLGKLILHVLGHPSLIPKLMRFDAQIRGAALALGPAIERTLAAAFALSRRSGNASFPQ